MHQQQVQYQYVPRQGGNQQAVNSNMNVNTAMHGAVIEFQHCPFCSYKNQSLRQLNQHQFQKNHVYFCGFESQFRANDHIVTCDKWFYTQEESDAHARQDGHFYGKTGSRANNQQQQVSRAHDFYEDMRAQNLQVPVQQQRQQKNGSQPVYEVVGGAQYATVPQHSNKPQQRQAQPQRVYQEPQPNMQQPQYAPVNQPRGQPRNNAGAGVAGPQYPQLNSRQGPPPSNQSMRGGQQQPIPGSMAPIFECVPCQRQFQTQAALMNHVEKKHPEQGEIRPEELELGLVPIDQMLSRKGQPPRQQPMQQRVPPQQQPTRPVQQQPAPQRRPAQAEVPLASCNTCGREFVNGIDALEKHQLSTGHTQECSCEVCGKVFKHDHALTRHIGDTGHSVAPQGRRQQQPKKTQNNLQAANPKTSKNSKQQDPVEEQKQGRNKNGSNTAQSKQQQAAKPNKKEATPSIFKCEVCQTVYKTNEQLKDHRKTPEHSAKVVSAAKNYQGGSSKSQANNSNGFPCRDCTRSFQSEKALGQHQVHMHAN